MEGICRKEQAAHKERTHVRKQAPRRETNESGTGRQKRCLEESARTRSTQLRCAID